MITVCISSSQHDASICILENEKVLLYVQEERISKIKHDSKHIFSSIKLIKKYTNKIDFLIFSNCNFDYEYYLNYFLKEGIEVSRCQTDVQNHHLFHASSAFYGSGFDDAICLVIDGWGSEFQIDNNNFGKETSSIYYASYPSNFELLYKNVYHNPDVMGYDVDVRSIENRNNWEINSHLDIGVIYGVTSRHIGFSNNQAGKTMGLSSYGISDNSIPNFNIKNTIYSDKNLFSSNRIINTKLFPEMQCSIEQFQKRANISYKVQKYLEKVFLYRITQSIELKPDCKNIVFSGGCALNILGNSIIKKHFPNINFYVDPVANDACQSYGSAKYFYYRNTNSTKKDSLNSLYTGPIYDLNYMRNLVIYEVFKYNELIKK